MLDLAWATTVHKAQGSEARVVIQVMTPASRRLASRRLLYTGECNLCICAGRARSLWPAEPCSHMKLESAAGLTLAQNTAHLGWPV